MHYFFHFAIYNEGLKSVLLYIRYLLLTALSKAERVFEAAERLRGVQIECSPATELISKYNYKNVLIYCDPPYMAETRSGGTQYKKEMSDEDHEILLNQLLKHPGPVLLSGYHSSIRFNVM